MRVASVQGCANASAEFCNRGTRPTMARPLMTRSWVHLFRLEVLGFPEPTLKATPHCGGAIRQALGAF